MSSTSLSSAGSLLAQSAQPLLEAAQRLSSQGTFDLPVAVGRHALEAVNSWDDAVLQTLGIERNRYSDNLLGKDVEASLLANERLALALWLAMDFPSAVFEASEDSQASLPVTWQPEHARALQSALEEAVTLSPTGGDRPRSPKP